MRATMLHCHCRTAALRIFVRGITNLQFPATTLHRPCVRAGNRVFLPSCGRSFAGTSRARANQGAAAAAATTDDVQSLPAEHSDVPATGGASELTADSVATVQTNPKSTAKQRRPRTNSAQASRKDEKEEKKPGATITRANGKDRPDRKNKAARKDKPHRQDDLARQKRAVRKGFNATKTAATTKPPPPKKKEDWQLQRNALKTKFPEGWQPRKRLSPDALQGIRALHERFPDEYPTEVLAARFEVSPEAIRRILRSKWTPSPEEEERREERWFNRGKEVWARWAELGGKPPRRWRREGVVRKPYWNQRKKGRMHEGQGRGGGGGGDGGGGRGDGTERSRLAQNLI